MFKNLCSNTKKFLPFICLSIITGIISAIIITAFKIAAEYVIHFSNSLYSYVRENPIYIPISIILAAILGFVSSLILTLCDSCRGGGIPTSVAAIRGIISFRWFVSIVVLPISALVTFLSGVPLGTEGPCVQMGTAIGDGVAKCIGRKKNSSWRQYIMSGGATAGFSIATSSPITAIIFSLEELHKKLSPILFIGSSISVAAAQITIKLLSPLGINTGSLFNIQDIQSLTTRSFYAPLLIGIVCGICSILFTRFYHSIDNFIHFISKKISIKILFPIIFASASIIGLLLSDTLGTGHALVEQVLNRHILWYMIILIFIIRTVYMMLANTSGITGGIFLPTLAFGAMIGSLCADLMISLNLLNQEHYILMVVLGISAFLGSTSRIPITACVFSLEALGGVNNILPIITATSIAFLIVELSGLEDFTDTVINAKMRSINKNKEPQAITDEQEILVGKQ